MTRFARHTAIVSALVVGGFLAIFFGFLNHSPDLVACTGCQLPRPVFVAKVLIPKEQAAGRSTSGRCTQPSTSG
jgi:hypothetical protein